MIFSTIASSGFYVPTWFWWLAALIIVCAAIGFGLLLWLIVRGAVKAFRK